MASIHIENSKSKTRLPGLYDNPYRRVDLPLAIAEFDAAQEQLAARRPSKEITARRRRVAAAVTGLVLSPWLVRAGIDSYSYGYHSHTQTPAAQKHHK